MHESLKVGEILVALLTPVAIFLYNSVLRYKLRTDHHSTPLLEEISGFQCGCANR
jgi:hypothetical protein